MTVHCLTISTSVDMAIVCYLPRSFAVMNGQREVGHRYMDSGICLILLEQAFSRTNYAFLTPGILSMENPQTRFRSSSKLLQRVPRNLGLLGAFSCATPTPQLTSHALRLHPNASTVYSRHRSNGSLFVICHLGQSLLESSSSRACLLLPSIFPFRALTDVD